MKQTESPAHTDIDKLVHEPARLKILLFLAVVREADFSYLLYQTKLSRGNLSVHLQKLEAAEYIEMEKKFVERKPRTMVSLTDKGEKALKRYKCQLAQLLDL